MATWLESLTTMGDIVKVGGGIGLSLVGVIVVAQIILKFQTGVVGPQQMQLESQRHRIDELELAEKRLALEHRKCQMDYQRVIALLADHGIAIPDRIGSYNPEDEYELD